MNKIVDVVSRRAAEWKATNVVGELGHVDRVQLPELDEFGRQDRTNNLECTVNSSMIGDVVRDKAVGQQGVSFAGDHQIKWVAAARLKIQKLVDDLPSDSLLVFTDGSRQEEPNRTACAFFIPKWSTEKAFLLHEGASIFTAEVAAINRALRHIYSHDCLVAGQEIFVFSDSQAAVRSIISMAAIKEEIVLETLDAIACLKSAGNAVTLVWIPSNIGVIGNDKADSLAAAECKAPSNRARDSTLSVTEAVAKYKKTWCETRRKELHKSKKAAVRFHTTPTITP